MVQLAQNLVYDYPFSTIDGLILKYFVDQRHELNYGLRVDEANCKVYRLNYYYKDVSISITILSVTELKTKIMIEDPFGLQTATMVFSTDCDRGKTKPELINLVNDIRNLFLKEGIKAKEIKKPGESGAPKLIDRDPEKFIFHIAVVILYDRYFKAKGKSQIETVIFINKHKKTSDQKIYPNSFTNCKNQYNAALKNDSNECKNAISFAEIRAREWNELDKKVI